MRDHALKAIFALLGVLVVLNPGAASANAILSSSPTAGAVVVVAPNAVSITGTSTLLDQGNTISVTDPVGNSVDDGSLTISETTAVIGLKPLKAPGVYTVSYSLLAANEPPLTSSYTFVFNAPGSISSTPPTPTPSPQISSPSESTVNNAATLIIYGLIAAAFLVIIFLIWYARMIIRERSRNKRKTRAKPALSARAPGTKE